MTILKHIDPDRRIDRWYSVAIQQTLLAPIAVVCAYGNRRSSWQKVYALSANSREEAEIVASKIILKKIRRGYIPVEMNSVD
jgi:hypothetical protein